MKVAPKTRLNYRALITRATGMHLHLHLHLLCFVHRRICQQELRATYRRAMKLTLSFIESVANLPVTLPVAKGSALASMLRLGLAVEVSNFHLLPVQNQTTL